MPRWGLLLAPWIGLALSFAPPPDVRATGIAFTAIGPDAGLNTTIVFGKRDTNTYVIETTGTGVAMFDYDADGWVDLFFVNGSTLEGFTPGAEPTNRLYRNRRNGTFEDVTDSAGVAASGWGQGACAGDYDNDGFPDLAVTYWGQNRLYRNDGRGRFADVSEKAGMRAPRRRWSTGCAFLDYDRDGRLDLFIANYLDFDPAATPRPDAGLCRYRGLPVACGPSGLPPAPNALYRNRGDGTFADVSAPAGITRTSGIYALGVSTIDFDNDGWTDLYVAGDSSASVLYRNNHDGTFTDVAVAAGCAFSEDGRAQAGMGVAIGDYDRNGWMDVFKTNFAGDTSTLYANSGKDSCEDRTFAAGLGVNTRWLGWGTAFADFDNDGWLDLLRGERPRLPGSAAVEIRGRLRAAQGAVPQPSQRPVPGCDGAGWRTADAAEGGARRRVRRHRQRRLGRRGDRERQRSPRSVSHRPRIEPLDRIQTGGDPIESRRHRRRGCASSPAAR